MDIELITLRIAFGVGLLAIMVLYFLFAVTAMHFLKLTKNPPVQLKEKRTTENDYCKEFGWEGDAGVRETWCSRMLFF